MMGNLRAWDCARNAARSCRAKSLRTLSAHSKFECSQERVGLAGRETAQNCPAMASIAVAPSGRYSMTRTPSIDRTE
eukprot:3054019-Alexandrium_andersonii.AAC.2